MTTRISGRLRYWTSVFPLVCGELGRWRRAADAIPDQPLRDLALLSLRKRGNMEGAAVFAAFAPRRRRAAVVRACVAFQTAYNYLDVLSEQPCANPGAQARGLHRALVAAVSTAGEPRPQDFYAESRWGGGGEPRRGSGEVGPRDDGDGLHDDGGYLVGLIQASRAALDELPSHDAIERAIVEGAQRIVSFRRASAGATRTAPRWPAGARR